MPPLRGSIRKRPPVRPAFGGSLLGLPPAPRPKAKPRPKPKPPKPPRYKPALQTTVRRGLLGLPYTATGPALVSEHGAGQGAGKPSIAKKAKNLPKGVKGTAATIPPHAKTPARKSTPLASTASMARSEAVAGSSPVARPPRLLTRPSRPAATAVSPVAVAEPDLTDEQLVQQLLAPQYQANDLTLQRELDAERQNAQVYQGLRQALMKELSGIPAQVSGDYDRMREQTLAMANASADRLAAANPNSDTQGILTAIGAPPEQQQQIADENRDVFQGGAALLEGTQGFIPGETLAKVGAAQTAFARSLPATFDAQMLRALRQLEFEGLQTRQKIGDDRGLIAAQSPKLLMDIRSQRADQTMKERALQNEEFSLGLRTRAQLFNEQATTSRLGLSKQSLALRALQSDRNWQATLERLGIAEAGLKLRVATAQSKLNSGGFTGSQMIQLRKRAGKVALDAWNGVPVKEGGKVIGANHMTYQQAMSRMLAEGIPLTVAQGALNTYWSRPGLVAPFELDPDTHQRLSGAGRPLLSYQQRQALAKTKKKRK